MRADPGADRSRRARRWLAALGAFGVLIWLPAANAAGQGRSTAAKAGPIDAVVQEVVRMLDSKVSEPVILRWLDTEARRPAAVGSRELIELKRAGASDQLTEKLLDLAAKGAAAQLRGSHPAPPSTRPAPASTAPPASAATSGTPAGSAEPAGSGTAHGGAAPLHAANLHWTIEYHPNLLADDIRWNLFVYLDGRYLAWVKAPLVSFLDKPLEFDRSLAAGHHLLRLIEERHLRKPLGDWENQARVAPKALEFDLAPDAAGKVDLRLEVRSRGGPISLRITQGDAEVAKAQPSVPLPENWPPLCEEVPGQREPCLHWGDLWPGVAAPPSREEVRGELARRDFQPDPARSGE